jgi:hypothetical protein
VRALCLVLCTLLAGACALSSPDHFYALDSENSPALKARSAFAMQINLHVSLPMMVDRSEIILSNANGVSILEHERWAAPLPEQFSTTLGQDIEARRPDVIVASRGVSQPDGNHLGRDRGAIPAQGVGSAHAGPLARATRRRSYARTGDLYLASDRRRLPRPD